MATLLPVSFFILKYSGLWPPVHWTSGWKLGLYNLFTYFYMSLLSLDTVSQIIDTIVSPYTISEYADNCFITLAMFAMCFKIFNIVRNRKEILSLMMSFSEGSFKAKNKEEEQIIQDCESITKWRTIIFCIFVQIGCANLIISSILYLAPYRKTITRIYLPWDEKTLKGYWAAWSLQAINRYIAAAVTVPSDSLVSGVLYRAAAQFQILALRLEELMKPRKFKNKANDNNNNDDDDDDDDDDEKHESKMIEQVVKEHLEIIQNVSTLNDIFGFVIFLQYVVSSISLCITLLVFTEIKEFDTKAALVIVYTGNLYFQIYLLCSAGSELTLQSSNFSRYIYTCDWNELTISTKKSLILMMMTSHQPLEFTSWHLIDLSIESFSKIVKLSYSAYNVLAQKKD